MTIGDRIQSADWKKEKHVPTIECPDQVETGMPFLVNVAVGKEIPHPNTTEHHIRWIDVYFQPAGDKFVYQVGHFDFGAHGEGTAYAHPAATLLMQVNEPGTLIALSLCNIHGLWESSKEIATSG
ncbi:MAG: class II SORL domain-containing protein [Anaerolineae bacterium]|nr:class II SORL domain-containing protein [Anaerolineae bacterium]